MSHATFAVDDQEAARRFDEYRAAAAKAQSSGNVQDGIIAGHAWARFLRVFEGLTFDEEPSLDGTPRR